MSLMFPGWSQRTGTVYSEQDLGSSEYLEKGMGGAQYDIRGNAIEVFESD